MLVEVWDSADVGSGPTGQLLAIDLHPKAWGPLRVLLMFPVVSFPIYCLVGKSGQIRTIRSDYSHFCVWWVGAEKCYSTSGGCIRCLAGGFESVGEHGKNDRFLAVTRWLKIIQEQPAAHADTCRMMETVRLRSSWP